MALNTIQVTLGAAKTQVSATSIPVRQVSIQNNAAAVVRVGDANVSSTRGYSLNPSTVGYGGSITFGELGSYNIDLKDLWLLGTNTQVIDVIYID